MPIKKILRLLIGMIVCALPAACGYEFTARKPTTEPHSPPSTSATQPSPSTTTNTISIHIDSQATEPGLPLMLRRALDTASSPLGLQFIDPNTDIPLSVVTVTLRAVELRPLVVVRSSEDTVSGAAYEVSVIADAHCIPYTHLQDHPQKNSHTTTLTASAPYRDLSSPLATDDARRDAISRAAFLLAQDLAAWIFAACVPH
jgi:hypothetical protein